MRWTWAVLPAVGCVWVTADDAGRAMDPDGDGVPGLAYGGTDCFPDDPTRVELVRYVDLDGDGWGGAAVDTGCAMGAGEVERGGDCLDASEVEGRAARVNPTTTWFRDGDGDGAGDPLSTKVQCEPPPGYVLDPTDCDDDTPGLAVDSEMFLDKDDDGFGAARTSLDSCGQLAGLAAVGGDCDDRDPAVTDHWWRDSDGDGHGDPETPRPCEDPGATPLGDDCDDTETEEHPGAVWYTDADGDGDGDGATAQLACERPAGTVSNADDCDDTDDRLHHATARWLDGDLDGYGAGDPIPGCATGVPLPLSSSLAFVDGDCDDADPAVFPGSLWYTDSDGDGYGIGDGAPIAAACDAFPSGYAPRPGDCDDADPDESPATVWYPDADGDGFGAGDAATGFVGCESPRVGAYAPNGDDCDDADPRVGDVVWDVSRDADGDGYADAGATPRGDCASPGWIPGGDCDDADPERNPDTRWTLDVDGDGVGDPRSAARVQCTDPSGEGPPYAPGDPLDCDDRDPGRAGGPRGVPERPEDGVDQDCDGFDLPTDCAPVWVSTPGELQAAIDASECATFVLAEGFSGPITAPGVSLLHLAGDPFGAVVLDGTDHPAEVAIETPASDVRLEGLRLEAWGPGGVDADGLARLRMRGVSVARSGPVLARPGAPAWSELRLDDVEVVDGEAFATDAIPATTTFLRAVRFDGALSAAPLLAVTGGGEVIVEDLVVTRSAVTDVLLDLQALAVQVDGLEVRDSIAGQAVHLHAPGPGSTLRAKNVTLEDDILLEVRPVLGLEVSGEDVGLDQVAVVHDAIEGQPSLGPTSWVSVRGSTLGLTRVELVGNDDHAGLSALYVERVGPGLTPLSLDRIAIDGVNGIGLDLASPATVEARHVTLVGFQNAGSAPTRNVTLGTLDHSILLTTSVPSIGNDNTFLSPGDVTNVAWPSFVSYLPGYPRGAVDLRTLRVDPTDPRADPYEDRGAYAGPLEPCGGWRAMEDCDGDGVHDSWEVTWLGSTAFVPGSRDLDRDGLPDDAEYFAGTLVRDVDSDGDGFDDGDDAAPLDAQRH